MSELAQRLATIALGAIMLTAGAEPAEAKCAAPNRCLCVAPVDSSAALRVRPSSVNVGFVNISEILRDNGCGFAVGDTIDLANDTEELDLTTHAELLIGLDCNANLFEFYLVLDDDTARCVTQEISVNRSEALGLNASAACAAEVDEIAPNPPCEDVIEGCGVATAPAAPLESIVIAMTLTLLVIARGPGRAG